MAEQTVKIDGVNAVAGTLPVSGTVSSAPSGVQDVNLVSPATVPISGTITALPSGTQVVSGTVTALPSGTQAVSGLVSTYAGVNPAITGAYVYSISNIAGAAAGNNFISLFNPLLSGKTLLFAGAFISCAAAGSATATEPIRGYRSTTSTLGTLVVNATDVAKFQTTQPLSLAEIRTGNPTVTLGPALFNVPSATDGIVDPTTTHVVAVPPGFGPFTLAAGEGIVLRTEAGDVDQRWNLSVVWGEI